MISFEGDRTVNADKVQLSGLIMTLKSELNSAKAVAQKRDEEIEDLGQELSRRSAELSDAVRRLKSLEKQHSADCVTIKSLEDNLATHGMTIARLEESKELIKSQLSEVRSYKKLLEENQKLEVDISLSSSFDFKNGRRSASATQENAAELLSEELHSLYKESMKMSDTINHLQDDNLDLREKLFNLESDFCILDESYKQFIAVSYLCENELLTACAKASQHEIIDGNKISKISAISDERLTQLKDKLFLMAEEYNRKFKVKEASFKKAIAELEKNNRILAKRLEQTEGLESNHSPRPSIASQVSVNSLNANMSNFELHRKLTEKELAARNSEISFKVKNDNLCQKVTQLEKELENRKRIMDNCAAHVRDLEEQLRAKNEVCNEKEIEMRNLELKNAESMDRLNKQNLELANVSSKLRESMTYQAQLTDEVNEKTEQICQFHSEKSKLSIELNTVSSELQNTKENERYLTALMNGSRQSLESKTRSLRKCEEILKTVVDKYDDLKLQNESLKEEINKLSDEAFHSKNQVRLLEQGSSAMANILKETQDSLSTDREAMEKLLVIQSQLGDCKNVNDTLTSDIKKLTKDNEGLKRKIHELQRAYQTLHEDYNKLLDIKEQAEKTTKNTAEWQKEQKERELIINKKISMQSQHISTLLEDRQSLIAKNNDLLRDAMIFRKEVEQYKGLLSKRRLSDTLMLGSRVSRHQSDSYLNLTDDDSLSYVDSVQCLQRMAKNMQRTRKFWENGINDALSKS